VADDSDPDASAAHRVFQPVVSLGNLLIILSMVGAVAATLIVTGREIQGLMDQIAQEHGDLVHETEMRVMGEKNESDARLNSERAIVNQITTMATQENRDVQAINSTLQDMRNDYRELLRVSTPSTGARK
jgi:hypothetical protein